MRLKNILFFFCLIGVTLFVPAQDDDTGETTTKTVRPAPFSMRLDFSVPTPMNSAWRRCMVGIGEVNLGFDYKVAGSLFVGLGYKGSMLYTPPKFFVHDVKTKMQMHNAYLSVGYDVYKTTTYFITPSINSGMCYTKYTSVQPKKTPLTYKPEYTSWFIEPKLTLNWLPDPKIGVSFHISYVVVNHVWDPTFIAMEDWISLTGTNQNAITSYINFGFGMYFGMGKGKTVITK